MHSGIKVDFRKPRRLPLPPQARQRVALRPATGGFTLIEIMVVVAIVAIIASIALPSYQQSVRKSRRADAVLALQQIQVEQEKLRAECTSYAGNLTGNRACGVLGYPKTTSPEDFYNLTLSNESATGYTATATATGLQADDAECPNLVLQVSGLTLTRTPAQCWMR
jgi:type IV pilus assembly protein PilE